MKREKIFLTNEELICFDISGNNKCWKLRDETYNFVDIERTDEYTNGPSWNVIVIRESDNKYFKWNCWDTSTNYGIGFLMEFGDNFMVEVFPKTITTVTYE